MDLSIHQVARITITPLDEVRDAYYKCLCITTDRGEKIEIRLFAENGARLDIEDTTREQQFIQRNFAR